MDAEEFATTYGMYANLPEKQLRAVRFGLEELADAFSASIDFDQRWPVLLSEASAHEVDIDGLNELLRRALHWARMAGVGELERQLAEVDEIIAERESRTDRA